MKSETNERCYEIENFDYREIERYDEVSGLTLEKTVFIDDGLRYMIITLDNKVIICQYYYEAFSDIDVYFDGMVHGHKIAMHRNERDEIMKEMLRDEPKG